MICSASAVTSSGIPSLARSMSLISMAWLWCGIIICANITSASLCAAASSAAEVAVAEVVALDVAAVVPVSVSLHAAAVNTTASAMAPTARVFLFMSGSFPRTVTDTGEPTTGDPRSRRTPD